MEEHTNLLKRFGFRYRFLREDPATGIHFATVIFPTGNGGRSRIEIPASTLSNRAELRRQLLDRDAVLPADEKGKKALLCALAEAQPKHRQTYAKAAGWSGNKAWFVTGRKVIGEAPVGQLATRPIANAAGEPGQLRTRGTARQWRDTVGRLALSSSVSMLAICIALAAPLLTFTNRTSFAICFFGRSRSGKTLASLCAASMIGIGRTEDLIGWRSTDTAIEERLSEFVDTIFVLDDVSAMDASEAEQYTRLRNFAYMVATNQGKARARTYKGSTGTNHARHRTIVLTSAETSIASLAHRSQRQQLGGEELRLIDLPVTQWQQGHIFDRLPDTVDREAEVRWRSQTYAEIVQACRRYHGAAFQNYVSRLIGLRRTLPTKVNDFIAAFVQQVEHDVHGPEARDLAEKFGLLFAGGMIGVELKCVPWTDAEVPHSCDHVLSSGAELADR